jgi:hypothetical protein
VILKRESMNDKIKKEILDSAFEQMDVALA